MTNDNVDWKLTRDKKTDGATKTIKNKNVKPLSRLLHRHMVGVVEIVRNDANSRHEAAGTSRRQCSIQNLQLTRNSVYTLACSDVTRRTLSDAV